MQASVPRKEIAKALLPILPIFKDTTSPPQRLR